MKKLMIATLLAAVSSVATAASLTTGDKTELTQTQCGMIATGETAKIQLSKDVTGAYDCSTTSAGVATYHPQGKTKTYSVSSNGGKLTEADGSDVASAATTAKNAS